VQYVDICVAMWAEVKRALWLFIAPFFILGALLYMRLALRRGNALTGLITPFGVVLLLIFITGETQDTRAVN
jgi:hypothetical protein